ncbi:MAG: FtsX-like permease family protein, partial [Planctomycetes bacterium]|nr:FtsX-like permease family protein [Planctomycetota bacterium]
FEVSSFPLNPAGGLAKAGSEVINKKRFYYSDDCHSGLVKVDGDMIFLSFGQAQSLFEMGGSTPRINSIHIKFSKGTSLGFGTDQVSRLWKAHVKEYSKATYANLLDNVSVEDWKTNRREIIAPMEKEQTMLMFLFAMLGVITVFIIFVVFYMIINSRSKDIGILKSVGVSSSGVVRIFGTLAIMIASVGSLIGVLGGCAFLLKINAMEDWLFEHYQWQLWNREVYAIGDIPNDIEMPVLVAIVASAIAAALIAVTVPSLQAARREPVEILQVNQM